MCENGGFSLRWVTYMHYFVKSLKNHSHCFVAKQQAKFYEDCNLAYKLKSCLSLWILLKTMILFFRMQGFHWNNAQATIHLFHTIPIQKIYAISAK